MRRAILVGVVLLAVVGGVFWWNRTRASASQTAAPTTEAVQRRSIVSTVPATGSVATSQDSKLSFSGVGTVVSVSVQTGDAVVAGQELARLDTADLERSLRQAQLKLSNDQIALNKTLSPSATGQDIENAEAAVRQSQTAVEAAQRNVDIVRYSSDVFQAPVERQNEYNYYLALHGKLLADGVPTEELVNEWTNVLIARGKLEQAQRKAADSMASAENAVRKAQDDVEKAQGAHAKLLEGPDNLAVQQARNTVELSRIGVETAQQVLDQAILRAPFDGRVASVGAKAGERVAATTVMVQLVSTSYLVQAQVDESQIATVKVGLPVQVSLDALPQSQQRPLSGRVSTVSPLGTATQGVVNYQVTIEVTGGAQAGLLPGMTAQANIVMAQANNVLAVPNRAIRRGATGSSVQVLEDGATREATVQVGLSDERYTEVIGLSEGALVVMPTTSTTTSTNPQNIRTGPGAVVPGGAPGGAIVAPR